MKRARKILSYLVVLAIGLVAGRVWGQFSDYSALWGEVADRDSHDAVMRVRVLSQLRLGRVDDAIESLELPLGNQVLMIAHGQTMFRESPLELDPQSMSPLRLRALQFIKAYLFSIVIGLLLAAVKFIPMYHYLSQKEPQIEMP